MVKEIKNYLHVVIFGSFGMALVASSRRLYRVHGELTSKSTESDPRGDLCFGTSVQVNYELGTERNLRWTTLWPLCRELG